MDHNFYEPTLLDYMVRMPGLAAVICLAQEHFLSPETTKEFNIAVALNDETSKVAHIAYPNIFFSFGHSPGKSFSLEFYDTTDADARTIRTHNLIVNWTNNGALTVEHKRFSTSKKEPNDLRSFEITDAHLPLSDDRRASLIQTLSRHPAPATS